METRAGEFSQNSTNFDEGYNSVVEYAKSRVHSADSGGRPPATVGLNGR